MNCDIDRILDEEEMINEYHQRNILIEQNIDEHSRCIGFNHEVNENLVQKFRSICQTIQ